MHNLRDLKYVITMVVVVLVAELCPALRDPMEPSRLLCPWGFPGKNTEVGSHSLLQRILPPQGSNPGLLHCTQILYHLSYREVSM